MDLPPEIVLEIVQFLDYKSEINAFSRVSRCLHELLNPILYRTDARDRQSYALEWAALEGSESAALKALAAGTKPTTEILGFAASRGQDRLVELLCRQGVSVNSSGPGRNAISPDDNSLWTPLGCAAYNGHLSTVRLLIEYGAIIDRRCAIKQETPLALAAMRGHVTVIKALVEAGADIEAGDRFGQTPLENVAGTGRVDVVKELLERGAKINARADSNFEPMTTAAVRGDVETVQCMLDHGAVPSLDMLFQPYGGKSSREVVALLMQRMNYPQAAETQREKDTIACAAAATGQVDVLEQLISRGWDVRSASVSTFGFISSKRATALSWAADNGYLDVARLLLARGADPNGKQKRPGRHEDLAIPLMCAARHGHADIIDLLLDHGADITIKQHGDPVLFHAYQHDSAFRLLLAKGAEFRGVFALDGKPLAARVVSSGRAEPLQMLLDRGIEFKTGFGDPRYTLLEIVANSNEDILKTLLRNGFDPQPGEEDLTVLCTAAMYGNTAFLELLIQRGFDAAHPDRQAVLLTHAASARAPGTASKTLALLLSYGLDIEAKNIHGRTALLDILSRGSSVRGRSEIIPLLLERGANPCFRSDRSECPLVTALTDAPSDLALVRSLLDAIDEQKIPFEVVEPQLCEAITVASGRVSKEGFLVSKVLRRYYWRRRYPVP
ncbi:ankyrin repeat-containing domain protein [Aspergillus californicus]